MKKNDKKDKSEVGSSKSHKSIKLLSMFIPTARKWYLSSYLTRERADQAQIWRDRVLGKESSRSKDPEVGVLGVFRSCGDRSFSFSSSFRTTQQMTPVAS